LQKGEVLKIYLSSLTSRIQFEASCRYIDGHYLKIAEVSV
jgi:hypothetical protein